MQISIDVVLCSVWFMAGAQQMLTINITMCVLIWGYMLWMRLFERKIWKQEKVYFEESLKGNSKAENSELRVP